MPIEYAQMMSTAHRMLDGELYIDDSSGRKIKRWKHPDKALENVLYKATHVNHPSAIWVRESKANYEFMYEMWSELCKEFRRRFNNDHLSETKLIDILAYAPDSLQDKGITHFPQCMPEKYHNNDPVQAYRDFYKYDKTFAKYYSKYPERYYS